MTAITWRQTSGPRSERNRRIRHLGAKAAFTAGAGFLCLVFILPLIYMVTASLQSPEQQRAKSAPLWPAKQRLIDYVNENGVSERIPLVVVPDYPQKGQTKVMGAVSMKIARSVLVDPSNPQGPQVTWVGPRTALQSIWDFQIETNNFNDAIGKLGEMYSNKGVWPGFLATGAALLFMNTLGIALIGTFGAVLSAILVAYGFARFRVPHRDTLFIILIGTILLPFQVVLIPQYIIFNMIGWTNTWLPLLVPHFFSNAYNVFLLRQYFMTLPRELDEAAMMDGAGPFRILVSVIIPQSWPAIISVCLFHFFFAWNDFLGPLVYLSTRRELQVISIGLNFFNTTYRTAGTPSVIQAGALLSVILPVAIFFIAQRVFMRGVVISGVEK